MKKGAPVTHPCHFIILHKIKNKGENEARVCGVHEAEEGRNRQSQRIGYVDSEVEIQKGAHKECD